MNPSRRHFLRGLATMAGTATAASAAAQHVHPAAPAGAGGPTRPIVPIAPGKLGPGVVPVVSPDIPDMPWRFENGVKVFEIAAEHVRTEFVPGRIVDAWGFNGSVPGPTIQGNEGDRVRLIVENRLPELFSMHWHGLEIPVEIAVSGEIRQLVDLLSRLEGSQKLLTVQDLRVRVVNVSQPKELLATLTVSGFILPGKSKT